MTGKFVVVPGLGGVTSSTIVVEHAIAEGKVYWPRASVSMPVDALALENARRVLSGGYRDRLAELREAAARRARELPTYDDPIDEAADRAQLVEGFQGLQAETGAWDSED